ncbi:hypothetical protein [Erythrobacter sp. YT30]|uniref:hypothetical protein n=1 Tax=Erythrobacter sp. YT30 TaxID=1735012 RepID=UPI00076D08B4|nr:hypothetical protein [Erythrobacter sp. YT30]KWV91686.1 hypothetical protein AUC45_10775 [Erythrobacter sp. YT30]
MIASLEDGLLRKSDADASAFAIAAIDLLGAELEPGAATRPGLLEVADLPQETSLLQGFDFRPSDTRAALSIGIPSSSDVPAFASPDIAVGDAIAVSPEAVSDERLAAYPERGNEVGKVASIPTALSDKPSAQNALDQNDPVAKVGSDSGINPRLKAANADGPQFRSTAAEQGNPAGKAMPSGNPLPVGEQITQPSGTIGSERTEPDLRKTRRDRLSSSTNDFQRDISRSDKADQRSQTVAPIPDEIAGENAPKFSVSSAVSESEAEPLLSNQPASTRGAEQIASMADPASLRGVSRKDANAVQQVTARAAASVAPLVQQTQEAPPKQSLERAANLAEQIESDGPAEEQGHSRTASGQPVASASPQGPSTFPQVSSPAAITPSPATNSPSVQTPPSQVDRIAAPQLDQAIDQLTQVREASRTARSELTIRHAEFGAVNMRLEAAGGDLRAILANRDPAFLPAVQAALADRAVAAASETSNSSHNQSGSRQSENGASTQSQNGGNWGSGAGSERSYGSFLGGERSASQPSLEQLEDERHSGLSRGDDGSGNPGSQEPRERGLFA